MIIIIGIVVVAFLLCVGLFVILKISRRETRVVKNYQQKNEAYEIVRYNLREQAHIGVELAKELEKLKQTVDAVRPKEILPADKKLLQEEMGKSMQLMNCWLCHTNNLFDRLDNLACCIFGY